MEGGKKGADEIDDCLSLVAFVLWAQIAARQVKMKKKKKKKLIGPFVILHLGPPFFTFGKPLARLPIGQLQFASPRSSVCIPSRPN